MRIAVTQRVDLVQQYSERRDALDQSWPLLLQQLGFLPVIVPNLEGVARRLIAELGVEGVLLTGGNSPVSYGGDAPERDAVEHFLLDHAQQNQLPVLGICRGMQILLEHFGSKLIPVSNHVRTNHEINLFGTSRSVNSYHNLGLIDLPDCFQVLSRANDSTIEAARHATYPFMGIMWHPERMHPFDAKDLQLIDSHFRGRLK